MTAYAKEFFHLASCDDFIKTKSQPVAKFIGELKSIINDRICIQLFG